jgi:hypothetical protein
MKKYFASALAIALIGASIASIAQSAPMDHSSHGMGMMGMDSSDMQAMQKRMSAAKTDEERKVLMAEHQKQMAGKQGSMMGMNHGEMQSMREAMQKKLSAAKTDEERRALMAEQQKLMMEKRSQIMSSNGDGQTMNGMPGNMAERQQMMQKRMGMGMMPM